MDYARLFCQYPHKNGNRSQATWFAPRVASAICAFRRGCHGAEPRERFSRDMTSPVLQGLYRDNEFRVSRVLTVFQSIILLTVTLARAPFR